MTSDGSSFKKVKRLNGHWSIQVDYYSGSIDLGVLATDFPQVRSANWVGQTL